MDDKLKKIKEAYQFLFDADDGIVVLDDLENRFHCNTSTFSPDSHETAFREGQRSVVLFIKNMLINDEYFQKLIKEHSNE